MRPRRRSAAPCFANPVGATSFPENRGGESTLGNLVADVQRWSLNEDGTRDVDITFMNPGGLRADIDAGEVTYKEAANVQPFANTLVSMDLTGAQVKKVLEEQWQPAGASRPFLKLGVNKELDLHLRPGGVRPGSRITEIMLNGQPLDPAAVYSVGANSFLAAGGDNFFTLAAGTNKADSGKIDLESMVDWFDAFGTATPDLKQRAVGVQVVWRRHVRAGRVGDGQPVVAGVQPHRAGRRHGVGPLRRAAARLGAQSTVRTRPHWTRSGRPP